MALIDNYLKKKDKINIERPRDLLIDRYTTKERAPVVEPAKKPTSLLDRIKGVGKGVAKFAVGIGIEAANMATGLLDFTADFLSRQIEKQKRKPSITAGPLVTIPIGKETEASKKRADRWKNFYESSVGQATEKMKSFTQDLRGIDFIQPSEEWIKMSTKDKFDPKKGLGETILNIGPGVVASLGMYAINPTFGAVMSFGSTADDVKTIAIENGVNEDRANLLATSTGFVVMWLDKIVPDEVFSPAQKKTFINGFVKRIFKTGLKEAGTEILQEDVQLLAEATVREDITKDEVIIRNLMSGLGGVLGGVGAQTTVSFVNGVRSGDIGGLEEDFVKPPVVKEKVEEIIRAPEVKQVKPEIAVKEDVKVPEKIIREVKQPIKPKEKIVVKKEVKKPVVVLKPKAKEITEKQIKTTKNIKDTKTILRKIQTGLSEAVVEAEASALIAQEKRAGVNVEDINKLKRIYAVSKKFQEGDIETIRASKHRELLNNVIENVQEVHPEYQKAEAFAFALTLPTKAEESIRTLTIRELEKKQKKLSKFMDLLKARQKELKIEADDELSREWTQALAVQEKLEKIVRVPKRQLPVGEGKERVSRLQARLKGALENASEENVEELGLTTYRQMNQVDQIAKASEYVENNTEEALRVVRGEIDPPEGILQNSVFAALVELGKVDTDVATQVATLTATRFGQEINILKKILADNPVVMMQDIVKTRIEAYEKRTGRKVSKRVKQETAKIAKKVQPTTKEQWNLFIESIRC